MWLVRTVSLPVEFSTLTVIQQTLSNQTSNLVVLEGTEPSSSAYETVTHPSTS